jgi:hypothetical protein
MPAWSAASENVAQYRVKSVAGTNEASLGTWGSTRDVPAGWRWLPPKSSLPSRIADRYGLLLCALLKAGCVSST